MAFYPCRPSDNITPTTPSTPIGFYKCWPSESSDSYLTQFNVDPNASSFNTGDGNGGNP